MSEPTRYRSFATIDFDGNIEAVLAHLQPYFALENPFLERFRQRLHQAENTERPQADTLLLLHAHATYLSDLFEEHDDHPALAALAKLEEECF
ncbi:N(2)-fixation sustaining protein CowN [mine drainage metagenome]|uniref:N(2)-fixation sustaining protein CowN n=1 Tax=mine drainage metagenome TaxID=410659 RepID=A0A1J5RFN3_9ZZZZ